MTRHILAAAVVAAAVLPATADAKPTICTPEGVTEVLTAEGESSLAGVAQIRCGDVNADGDADAVFTLLSGGTAGTTKFGVIAGGGSPSLLLFKDGYKVSVDRVNHIRFDVQQPIYKASDPNCCPSSVTFFRYQWNGSKFKRSRGDTYKKPKQRFFKGQTL
jgi:hypothetical protein